MFTVKWRGIHGEDVLFQAELVIKNECACDKDWGVKKGQPILEFYNMSKDHPAEKAHEHIYYGTVYVMNETGATVAKYELGGWELVGMSTPPFVKEKKKK